IMVMKAGALGSSRRRQAKSARIAEVPPARRKGIARGLPWSAIVVAPSGADLPSLVPSTSGHAGRDELASRRARSQVIRPRVTREPPPPIEGAERMGLSGTDLIHGGG